MCIRDSLEGLLLDTTQHVVNLSTVFCLHGLPDQRDESGTVKVPSGDVFHEGLFILVQPILLES